MNEQVIGMLIEGTRDTLYMTFGSVIIGYLVIWVFWNGAT